MSLIPDSVVLPDLYAVEQQEGAALVLVHLYEPDGWHWYILERGGGEKSDVLFGLVDGHELEYGYISLAELEANGVICDEEWTPRPVGKLEQALRHVDL